MAETSINTTNSFNEILNQIPDKSESFEGVLDLIPDTSIPKFEQGTKSFLSKGIDLFSDMTGWGNTPEEERDKAAEIISISEHTGKSIREVVQSNPELDFVKDEELKNSIKERADRVSIVMKASKDVATSGSSFYHAMSWGDEKGMEEAFAVYKKAGEERAEVGGSEGILENIAFGLADFGAFMASMLSGAKEEATIGMGAALGLAATGVGVPAAIGAASLGVGYGVREEMYATFHGLQTMKKIEEGVEPRLAYMSSVPSAAVLAAIEQLKLLTAVKNIPGVGSIVGKALGKAVKAAEVKSFGKWLGQTAKVGVAETTQEVLQTIVEFADEQVARDINNELNNTNLLPKTKQQLIHEVVETIKAVGPAAFVIGGAGATTGLVGSTINRKANEAKLENVLRSSLGKLETEEQKVEQELQDFFGNPVTPEETVVPPEAGTAVVDEEGNQQPSMPITDYEQAVQQTEFDMSPINEEAFEKMILEESDESIDQTVENDIAISNQTGDQYGDFIASIRYTLPKKQAKVVEELIRARARATNRTKEKFVEDHQLSLRIVPGEEGGSVQFIKDGETIIRAFQNTTLKDVAHELAHVFRRDLSEGELISVETIFGVTEQKWSVANEEAFAKAFVQYVAKGETSNSKLTKVFEKLKTWLAHVYNTAKGENVNVSPEMSKIFDAMLAQQANMDYIHKVDQARQKTEILFSKKVKGEKVPTVSHETLGNVVKEVEAVKKTLVKLAKMAKKAHRTGNKQGFKEAKAAYKATIQRNRNRRATKKAKQRINKNIKKIIKKMEVVKRRGRKYGKFTASFQDQADLLISIMKMTQAEARVEFNKIANIETVDGLKDVDILALSILEIKANMRNMSEGALGQIHDDILNFYKHGKSLRHKEIKERQNRVEESKKLILDSLEYIREKKGFSPNIKDAYANTVGKARQRIDYAMQFVFLDFHGMMEMLDMGLRDALGDGPAALFGETLDAENQSNSGRISNNTKIIENAAKIYGKEGIKDVERMFFEEERQTSRVVFEYNILNKKGEETDTVRSQSYNQSELRNLYMELQDEEVRKVWEEDGFTNEHKRMIEAELEEEDLQFIKFQLDFYDEYYNGINEVYRRVYGVNLDKRENYSPINRDIEEVTEAGPINDLLQEIRTNFSTTPSPTALVTRVNSRAVTSVQSDIGKMNNYIRQMEHFKAFAPKIMEFNNLFKDKKLRSAVISTYGSNFMGLIDRAVSNLARNGASIKGEQVGDRFFRSIRANLARGLVGGKALAAVKQLSSAFAYVSKMPVQDYMAGMMEFLKDPKAAMAELKELSQFVQNRGETIDRDISLLMNNREFNSLLGTKIPPSFNKMVMMFVRAGDIGAIYAGGWVYYKHLMKEGYSQKDAIRQMEIVSRNTQQSAELGSQSMAQQGGELWKLFTMFTTAQRQYAQQSLLTVAAYRNQKMDGVEATKMLGVYVIALPVLFQLVAQAFSADDEGRKVAMKSILSTPLSAIPFVNVASEYILSDIIQGHTYGRNMSQIVLLSPAESAYKGTKKMLTDEDITYEEILKAFRDMLAAMEYTGVPGRAIGGVITGASDVSEGLFDADIKKVVEGGLEVSGMSPYMARKRVE